MADASQEKWSLTQAAFESLLGSLHPDRDAAAGRYLEIRRNLVRLFEWRGCPAPDEYADETLNRCARKIGEGEEIRDVATYCIGIARMLTLEMGRDRLRAVRSLEEVAEPRTMPADPDDTAERRLDCLRRCLAQLSTANRELILSYYQGDKSEKIANRKGLASRFGLPASTLRMKALRVRESLHSCAEKCLKGHVRIAM